jgi:hypothetical protein
LQGATFDPVETDDSTYTLQDEDKGRELCVTLLKTQSRLWPFVAK